MNTAIESLTYDELQQVARHLVKWVSRDTLEQAARTAIAHTSKHVRYTRTAWMKPAAVRFSAAEVASINSDLRGLTPNYTEAALQQMDDEIRGVRKLPRSETEITSRRGKRRW